MESKNFTHAGDPKMQCTCCGKGSLGPAVIVFLEHLKMHYDGATVHINSGARCKKYNTKTGSTDTSEHMITDDKLEVNTVDVRVKGVSTTALAKHIKSLPYANNMGIGVYIKDGFVHCDFRGYPARW